MTSMPTTTHHEPQAPRDATGTGRGSPDETGGEVLLVGFDGSHGAATAVAVAGRLMPARRARVAHLWSSPDAGSRLHRRLAHRARTDEHLRMLVGREVAASAKSVASDGVALAEAAGWTAEPLVRGGYGGEGLELARLAGSLRPAAVVVGSRGSGGLRGLFSSVSVLTANRSPVPVLVVPPLLAEERAATVAGPVLVAHDGSTGAERARTAAADLFPGRVHISVHVDTSIDGPPGPSATGSGPEGADERVLPPRTTTIRADGWGPRAVADALAEEAAAQGAAVIVVGSRGRSMVREVLLGSVARSLLQHGHRPVLVVPPDRRADTPGVGSSPPPGRRPRAGCGRPPR